MIHLLCFLSNPKLHPQNTDKSDHFLYRYLCVPELEDCALSVKVNGDAQKLL